MVHCRCSYATPASYPQADYIELSANGAIKVKRRHDAARAVLLTYERLSDCIDGGEVVGELTVISGY